MIAKTLTGLEGVLASELSALGAENVTPQNRAVEFEGNTELMYKINLWSRTALSILKPVFDFTFETQEQYYEILRAYEWDELFDVEKTIAINAIAFNSEFTNSLFLAQRTKDAVADYFTEKAGKRPSVDLEDPQIKLNIYINGDMCSVSLDSSGAPLFKRGYRRKNVQAPLNEVLAAGLIMLSGWDKKKPFYDPMCGSATFSIEAAMMALNMAPSIFRRHFSFQHWKDYDPELWESLREQARKEELKRVPPIIASDINNNAMDAARTNLMEAGLLGRVKLEKKDFFTSKPTHPRGMLILNPPYGLRLQTEDIHNYYKEIGTALKHNFTGFDAWIISPDKALTHKIGLRHTSQTMVYNGQLECRFLGYELYEGTKKTHKTEADTDTDSSENQPEGKEKHFDGPTTERRSYGKPGDVQGEQRERKPYRRSDSNKDNPEERKPYRRSTSGHGNKPERKPYRKPDSNTDNPEERKPYRRSTSGPGNKPERKPYRRSDNNTDNPEERKPYRRSTSGSDNKPERKSYGRSDSNKDNPEERKPYRRSTSGPGNKPERKPYVQRDDRSDNPRDKKPYGERANKNKGYKGEGSAFRKEGNKPYKREEKNSDNSGEKRSFRKQDSRPEKRTENKTDRPFKKKEFRKPGRRNDE